MADSIPSAMADKLAWFTESWSSVELRVHIDQTHYDGQGRGEGDEHYIETARGQRLYERSWPGVESGATDRTAEYADGTRFAEANWKGGRQLNAIYKTAFFNEDTAANGFRPAPLVFLYLHHQPLAKALPKAESLGQDRHLGRDCEILLLKGVTWSFRPVDMVYHLDRETALPLEVRCFDAGADRANDTPQWYWEARSFDRLGDGRYWPMRSADFIYGPTKGGGTKLYTSREIRVESILFNKTYSASSFRPPEEPGASVLDPHNKQYVVPGGKPLTKADLTVSGVAPAPATPPTPWTTTASTAGLIFGLALLVVGLIVWWRQRR
ncbi:MAG: hypothetical protein ABI353_00955 [Isosphaeraceae bacterium]